MDHEEIVGGGSTSFFGYMFSLNPNEKNDLLNMIQYVLLAIIPIILILKLMKKYIPPDNDKKASIEILIEVVVQLIVIFAAFWFIHKLIMFIPTYSKSPYPHFYLIQLIIPIVFILFSMNSTISEKANTLLNRAMVLVGLSKENCDEDEQAPKTKVAVIPPSLVPMVSSMEGTRGIPTYDQRQDPTFPPSGYQGGGQAQTQQAQQMQFQMNEPVAANEMVMGSMF
jgi:hypothetical protein